MNQNKFRQIQSTLEQTEERADEAENVLMREKSRIRNNSSSGRLANNSNGPMHSKTFNVFQNEKILANKAIPLSYSTSRILLNNKF